MTDPAPIPLTDGRYTVPGNRWDLMSAMAPRQPSVAVVIPYYEQQHELDLVLAALEHQDYPADSIEVVVADDGSTTPPVATAESLRCTVVRQPDKGFRAAAARNLGAAATAAEILCFLDADTVPEPGYLAAVTRMPSRVPDALVVGRRRHADLAGWTPAQLADWWSGGRAPRELAEPQWLADGYAGSDDLLTVDHRSYRYVISSVMCCSRDLFDDIGGFDESFVGYGGEDWEFAHRAMAGGAVLHHARAAVAWHNGPDWAARNVTERAAVKNAEALALLPRITDPDARRHGLRYDLPDVAVEIDAGGHGPGSLLSTMACFSHLDVGMWLTGADDRLLDALRLQDDRVRTGAVPDDVRRRCRFLISIEGRARLPRASVDEIIARCAARGVGSVELTTDEVRVLCRATWAVNRERRWSSGDVRLTNPSDARRLSTALRLAAHDLSLTAVEPNTGLSW